VIFYNCLLMPEQFLYDNKPKITCDDMCQRVDGTCNYLPFHNIILYPS